MLHSDVECDFKISCRLRSPLQVAIPFDDATKYSKGLILLGFGSPHALIHEATAEDLQKVRPRELKLNIDFTEFSFISVIYKLCLVILLFLSSTFQFFKKRWG